MSKYQTLWSYVHHDDHDELTLSFAEIEAILNFKLDHAFLNYKRELLDYGYEVNKISLKNKLVIFRKVKQI